MVKKKSSKSIGETRTSFMFPWLHKNVMSAVSHEVQFKWVGKSHNDGGADQEYSTHVMGRFRCTNNACNINGWSSKKVSILIRSYTKYGYNAVVFNQRCQFCDALGTFTLDKSSYVERVAYRIQKWAGIEVEPPYYASKEGPPHKQELCEGCKRGVCRQRNDWNYI